MYRLSLVRLLCTLGNFWIHAAPLTCITDAIPNKYAGLKRKNTIAVESASKKAKHPAYFIPELAHVCALCDERIPFTILANEVRNSEWLKAEYDVPPSLLICCDSVTVDETRNSASGCANRSKCYRIIAETSSVTSAPGCFHFFAWVGGFDEKASVGVCSFNFQREWTFLGGGVRNVRYACNYRQYSLQRAR